MCRPRRTSGFGPSVASLFRLQEGPGKAAACSESIANHNMKYLYVRYHKVNRCLARYSEIHNHQLTHQQGTKKTCMAKPISTKNANFGPFLVVSSKKSFFLLEES